MKTELLLFGIAVILLFVQPTHADQVRVTVRIENLAPANGTTQTPFWVGFHDGQFDIYDRNQSASTLPQTGSDALERLAEDGNTGPISEDFAALSEGIDGVFGGVLPPGGSGLLTFLLDSTDLANRYFSYASMVIPSNDFFVANGNPQAHKLFDDEGNFVAQDFFVTGAEVLDAGTEINDELPPNTAAFGQQDPDTGVDENGIVIGRAEGLVGFRSPSDPANPGNILADPNFAMGDFTVAGYPIVKISFGSAPAILEIEKFIAELSPGQEVPPVELANLRNAKGIGTYALRDDGTRLKFWHRLTGLGSQDIVAAHLHLAPEGQNGPVVAFLIQSDASRRAFRLARRRFGGELRSSDLLGPLTGRPLDALIAEIEAGNVYVNVHSKQFPAGVMRGQLALQ